jgi:hypothetical protein
MKYYLIVSFKIGKNISIIGQCTKMSSIIKARLGMMDVTKDVSVMMQLVDYTHAMTGNDSTHGKTGNDSTHAMTGNDSTLSRLMSLVALYSHD